MLWPMLANDRVRYPCDEGRPTGRPSFFSVLSSRSRQRFVVLDFKPQLATATAATHAYNPQVTLRRYRLKDARA